MRNLSAPRSSALVLHVVAASLLLVSAATGKPKVTSSDDLPRHVYPVTGSVTELVTSKEAFAPFAAKLRADLEADLASFDIEDKTTLQGIHGTLLVLDLQDERWDDALARVKTLRDLQDKPGLKLTTGMSAESRVAASRASGQPSGPAFEAAFEKEYAARVSTLPWKDVQDILQQTKGQLEIVSEALLLGILKEQLDPIVAKSGEISGDFAGQVAGMRSTLEFGLSVKDEMLTVLSAAVAANQEEKVDIWAARSLDLTESKGLKPVLVAIWDSGTDPKVFGEAMWRNSAEKENGKDDDGNGHVDDIHGLAWDMHSLPTRGALCPMTDATRPTSELQASAVGLFDMQAAVDSPAAQALRKELSELSTDQVKPFMEDLQRYTMYSHGTHVAGIAVDDNPVAKIMLCRFEADTRMIPEAPTTEDAVNSAKSSKQIVAHFKKHGVRVVNMSWVIPRSGIETALEQNGIGTPEERKVMAREQFEIMKKGLLEAFESAPEILFVGGAGNSNNDVQFDEFIPPMFVLPNLMIAGAVDQAGEATTFTSFGPTVNIYSNGFEVESYVPGGDRVKFSGTSMASPNIVNLAAKLIAMDPSLTPQETIALILDGADEKKEGDRTMRVINPKRSAELLAERRG